MLKLWDWMTGKEKHAIPIQEVVEPFVVVKGKKQQWLDEEEMEGEKPATGVRKKGRKKGKGKRKAEEVSEQDADMGSVNGSGSPTPGVVGITPEDSPQEGIRPEVEETVLAIHKIDSFETSRGKHLVFSATGFVFFLPLHPAPLTSCYKLHFLIFLRSPFTR